MCNTIPLTVHLLNVVNVKEGFFFCIKSLNLFIKENYRISYFTPTMKNSTKKTH